MKYRSRTDIISMILQAAMNGATKTRLMYSAYLSYAQVQEYLAFLTDRKLISFEEAMERLSRDERFRATVYSMNTLLVQKRESIRLRNSSSSSGSSLGRTCASGYVSAVCS